MSHAKVTTVTLLAMKERGEQITMLTAYDYPMARLLDGSGIDVVLVGDSLAMVGLGHDTTLPVTVEEMLHHTRAVARGIRRALIVADMPFLSYHTGSDQAVANAGRFLKEAGAHGVKVEGGAEILEVVERMVASGIPVAGHLGLTPQAVHRMGGYRIQAKTAEAAERLLTDALALEAAGIFCLILEGIPRQVAQEVTEALRVPTIGIGAGPHCDGQVLVTNDLLGFFDDFTPKFVKRYAALTETIREAVGRFRDEVQRAQFPAPEHTVSLDAAEAKAWETSCIRRRGRAVKLVRGQ
ncbi:MAG: 3-methyl-2-oxobutanoate hydroxymethyltransferase [Candidatus Methylomirabilales bacterium]